jgi:DNA replication protein DnaC
MTGPAKRGLRIMVDSALNRAYKDWPRIFNNDSTLTSAILDRLLHHAETIVIEGRSYRMKGEIES